MPRTVRRRTGARIPRVRASAEPQPRGNGTVIEVARDGVTPLRVFHMAGTFTKDGAKHEGKYQWTHLPDKVTRRKCTMCTSGTIPEAVKNGTQRSV